MKALELFFNKNNYITNRRKMTERQGKTINIDDIINRLKGKQPAMHQKIFPLKQ